MCIISQSHDSNADVFMDNLWQEIVFFVSFHVLLKMNDIWKGSFSVVPTHCYNSHFMLFNPDL